MMPALTDSRTDGDSELVSASKRQNDWIGVDVPLRTRSEQWIVVRRSAMGNWERIGAESWSPASRLDLGWLDTADPEDQLGFLATAARILIALLEVKRSGRRRMPTHKI